VLHKCANPSCSTPFRKLNQGKLFLVESDALEKAPPRAGRSRLTRRIEYYWLCDRCAVIFTLSYQSGRGIVPTPIAAPPSRASDSPHLQANVQDEVPDGLGIQPELQSISEGV